jgi:hypothetical protein
MVILRIILIAILIYYALKLIGRILLPWLFMKHVNSRTGHMNTEKGKQGDVTIQDLSKEKSKIINKDEGDYVDYEEIK